MRRWAFVLQLGPDTHAIERHFDGWIEEVETARELRFRSTEELLAFLGQCFDEAQRRERESHQTSQGGHDETDAGSTEDE